MYLNQIFKESQFKLIRLLGYDPNQLDINDIELIINKECFSNIDLNSFDSISICYRLINLKNRKKLTYINEIIEDIFSRLLFLGYYIPAKITTKLLLENDNLSLQIFEKEEDYEEELIYNINLCKIKNQLLRWTYTSLNKDQVINEFDKQIIFSSEEYNELEKIKYNDIFISIIIGVVNEILNYLDMECSLVRVNMSNFLYILESTTNLELIQNLQLFNSEIFLFDIDSINSYLNEIRINTNLSSHTSWETFHLYLTNGY